jgi:hypothetical protein
MRDNSIKLQRLIEELLDYQRALHARLPWKMKTVMLDEMVAEAAREHELAARAKGLRLALDAQSTLLEADPDKLRSVLDNLISNAVQVHPGRRYHHDSRPRNVGRSDDRSDRFGAGHSGRRARIDLQPVLPRPHQGGELADQGQRPRPRHRARAGRGARRAIAVVGEGGGGHFRVTLPRRSARALADAA